MPLIFAAYPELEIQRTFSPTEAAKLTGISQGTQRKYRHLGYLRYIEERGEGTGWSKFGWEEITCLALIGELVEFGLDPESASYFASSFSLKQAARDLRTKYQPNLVRGELVLNDFRAQGERGDPLLAYCHPQRKNTESYVNVTVGAVGALSLAYHATESRFGFWINFSEFQRRLCLRYEAIRGDE